MLAGFHAKGTGHVGLSTAGRTCNEDVPVFCDIFTGCQTADQGFIQLSPGMMNILVREYRCSGGTDTANPAAGNRCSGTGIPHLIDCCLRVYSLKAGSNPYTSRMDL